MFQMAKETEAFFVQKILKIFPTQKHKLKV